MSDLPAEPTPGTSSCACVCSRAEAQAVFGAGHRLGDSSMCWQRLCMGLCVCVGWNEVGWNEIRAYWSMLVIACRCCRWIDADGAFCISSSTSVRARMHGGVVRYKCMHMPGVAVAVSLTCACTHAAHTHAHTHTHLVSVRMWCRCVCCVVQVRKVE